MFSKQTKPTVYIFVCQLMRLSGSIRSCFGVVIAAGADKGCRWWKDVGTLAPLSQSLSGKLAVCCPFVVCLKLCVPVWMRGGAVGGLYPSLRLCGANELGLEGLCAPAWPDLL